MAGDMLDLLIAARYVARLLANRRIATYLGDNHPEIAREFENVTSRRSRRNRFINRPRGRRAPPMRKRLRARVEGPAVSVHCQAGAVSGSVIYPSIFEFKPATRPKRHLTARG